MLPEARRQRVACAQRLACVTALALAVIAGASEGALPPAVQRVFTDARVPLNAIGVVVQEVNGRQPLFTQQIDRALNPASVMKLVTTFAALELLGRDYRWKTDAFLGGVLERGTLHGDLVLKGGGDPKITVEQWQAFMTTLRARGLDTIDGDLVLDRTFFAPTAHDPAAFDREPLKPYNVGPDALLVNFKSVRFTFAPPAAGDAPVVRAEPALSNVAVGTLPQLSGGDCGDWRTNLRAVIADHGSRADVDFPGRYAAACGERDWWVALLNHPAYVHAMFDAYFRAAGGRFGGGVRSGVAPRGAAPFATLESPPLWDVVRDVNKLSNNVMARQIFLTLATVDAPPPATIARATETVRRWLLRHNLKAPELVLDNGSGLSRRERISAGTLARLLIAADKSGVREEFASSLAVAAMDGPVQRRFQDGTVAGQALLKTGTLEGVRALAGYVIDREGRRFVVVAIVNGPSAARAQGALDSLVKWVYRDAADWAARSR
jgi:D-alanyl-D-alanine carboxypeptidase/D-alanyl-D-alanine-endopeptidase (penicillin-binding protein 4)